MGFFVDKFVIVINENDIFDCFFKIGCYEKKFIYGFKVEGGFEQDGVKVYEDGVKEIFFFVMDILVFFNFECLLWFLVYQFVFSVGMDDEWNKKQVGQEVFFWLFDFKNKGGFGLVYKDVFEVVCKNFESERVSDQEIFDIIKVFYKEVGYVFDFYMVVGVEVVRRI